MADDATDRDEMTNLASAPVLPLRDHVEEYYAFVPAIGLCWLGGWAVAECWRSGALTRTAAIGLAGVYDAVALSSPETRTIFGA